MLLKKKNIGTMNQHVSTAFEKACLLLCVPPKVDTGANSRGTRLAKNRRASVEEVGMVVLLRHSEAARQVVWTNEQSVQIRDR